jgi:carboxymethylenebutenolidase
MPKTSFSSGGRVIAVEAFEPAAATGSPAVLMLHGADGLSYNHQYRTGARAIAAAGYRVFLVHYLDRTGERRASFATVFQNFSQWADTVRDALAWAAAQPQVDADCIGIVGVSLGAALGLAVCADNPAVKGLVSYFGPLPQGAIAPGARLPPTLVLHGGADGIVPVANAYAIQNLLAAQGVEHEVKVYAGEGHGFSGDAERDATRRVLAFLGRTLKGCSAEEAGRARAAAS